MALITTTGSLIRQYNAFTGLSAVERSQSGIARAEVVYYNVNDDWPAAGAGNNRLYQTGQIDLPKDFGYVLTDAYCALTSPSNASITAEAVSSLRIYPGGVLGPQINLAMESVPGRMDVNNTALGSMTAGAYNTNYPFFGDRGAIHYALKDKPSALIYPFNSATYTTASNPASVWEWSVGEHVVNDLDAYDVNLFIRFLQYDIDQSYNYVIQSPQLTR
tara:strand:- start:1259 stop:1912 length:654 start_codon:yes stop_codon:yes gene_type:complete